VTGNAGLEVQAPGIGGRLVVAEWQRRTEAEYRSAALASQVTLWLIQVGAPPDLIRDGLQVVEDELSHSELSAQVAGAAGGGEAPPVVDGRALTLPCPDGPLPAVALALVRFFCIGETVAVPMFRMLRAKATQPLCRDVLDVVLRDEARHRQFGWDGLDWLLDAHEPRIGPKIAAALPAMMAEVRQAYGGSSSRSSTPMPPDAEAWGLADTSAYAAIVNRALATDVAPRLEARGLHGADGAAAAGGDCAEGKT